MTGGFVQGFFRERTGVRMSARGCMDAWMHGCVDVWMCGGMDARIGADKGPDGWKRRNEEI